nr:hypothetical protein [Tanacetum cinerariifolium]
MKRELEKLKQEKENNQLKIENFDNAFKSLDKLKGSQISNNSKKGLGYESYHVVLPPPTGLFSPPKVDLSNSGLEEFKQPEFQSYEPKSYKTESKNASKDIPNELKGSPNAPLVKDKVSKDKDCSVGSPIVVEKKIDVPTITKVEVVRQKQQEKPVRKLVKYAEMYRPRAVNIARPRPVNTARLKPVNTARPRPVNTTRLRPVNTGRPNSAVVNAVRVNQAMAKVNTVNGEEQIQALVDKKKVIITETSVRSDLHLKDAEGTECLLTATIFEQLTLMGQVKGMLKHKESYVIPSHTKKIFANIKRQGKDFSGLGDQEDASKQGRMIKDLDADEGVALVDETQGRNDQDMFDTSIFDEEEVITEKKVSTADLVTTIGVKVSTAAITSQISMDDITLAKALVDINTSKPKAKGIVLFNNTMKWIDSFIPMDTKLVKGSEKVAESNEKAKKGSSKRAAGNLEQKDAKKRRIKEENEFIELKRWLEIIPEDDNDVTIEATPLSSKSPTIVDYKI